MVKAIYFGRKSGVCPEFSNFSKSVITVDGITYDNVEGAFQAAKTRDMEKRKTFSHLSGSKAKSAGRSLVLRGDWESVKLNVMLECTRAKYTQNPQLKNKLIATGEALILENTTGWKDNTWGCDFSTKPLGRNWLGLCIMKVRSEITGNDFISVLGPEGEIRLNITELFYDLAYKEELYKALGTMYNWIYTTGNFCG